MSDVIGWLEGKRTYIGAGILAVATFAGAVGWLDRAQAEYLGAFGMAVVAVGLRLALEKVVRGGK